MISEQHGDSTTAQARMRQRFMLPLILLGLACMPAFSWIDWRQGNVIAVIGDMVLIGMLMVALLLLFSESVRMVWAARACLAGLLIDWALLAPLGGPQPDLLLMIWWPLFPLSAFFLIPRQREAMGWFAIFAVLLFGEGLLFEISGRMADASMPYWNAVLATLFTAFVVVRWLELANHYQDRFAEGQQVLEEQTEQQTLLTQELAQAKKLEEIGLLTGGIAHDFNNILSIIIGHTEVLHLALDEEKEDVAESLKMISLGAAQGAGLARELLAFAGKAHFEEGPVCLDRIVHDMTTLQRIHMPKTIDMELKLRPVPALVGDSTPFEQVVLNLVRNAIDAMHGRSGRLEVGTETVDLSEEAIAELDLFDGPGAGHYIRLWVQDEGHGIREEDRRKVFEPFFTTKKGGSGLGLASLMHTIRQGQGGLRLSSEHGKGTMFELFFPIPEPRRAAQSASASDASVSGEFQVVRG